MNPDLPDTQSALATAEATVARLRRKLKTRKETTQRLAGALTRTEYEVKTAGYDLETSRADHARALEALETANEDLSATRDDLQRTTHRLVDTRVELGRCQFVSDRLNGALTRCWMCPGNTHCMEVDFVALNDERPIADGTPLPLMMRCNGGHTICGDCSEALADNYLIDKQTKRLCCGYKTAWPNDRRSRNCNKLFCASQLRNVLPDQKVLEIEVQSALRKERAQVASEAMVSRGANVANADMQDDMFTFKTPCCNIAWVSDGCMCVVCPGCERYFCQLCSRGMEQGMTDVQAHDHVRNCTFETFRVSFLFPYEIEESVLPKKMVHLAIKANYTALYQLQHFGQERLTHGNLERTLPGDVDMTRMSFAERRQALLIKITDVTGYVMPVEAPADSGDEWLSEADEDSSDNESITSSETDNDDLDEPQPVAGQELPVDPNADRPRRNLIQQERARAAILAVQEVHNRRLAAVEAEIAAAQVAVDAAEAEAVTAAEAAVAAGMGAEAGIAAAAAAAAAAAEVVAIAEHRDRVAEAREWERAAAAGEEEAV